MINYQRLEERFPAGQRVQIHLSAECPQFVQGCHPERGLYGHHPEEDGRTGVVVAYIAEDCPIGKGQHMILVHFDDPIKLTADAMGTGRVFAPSELIALETSPEQISAGVAPNTAMMGDSMGRLIMDGLAGPNLMPDVSNLEQYRAHPELFGVYRF